MDITDIIKNSFKYPFSDNKQFAFIFLTFVALGLFVGLSFAWLLQLLFAAIKSILLELHVILRIICLHLNRLKILKMVYTLF